MPEELECHIQGASKAAAAAGKLSKPTAPDKAEYAEPYAGR